MSEDQKKQLEQQLWNIANTLRGKMDADEFRDFAFVQHMIYHLANNGTMAMVLPHGALFRGSAEQHICRYLIENKNFLDAVIGLPANIFYGTSIPTCILVFKKCRENPNDILFIDASNDFEKVKKQNVLRKVDIDKIITHYRNRNGLEKYSKIIPSVETPNLGVSTEKRKYHN